MAYEYSVLSTQVVTVPVLKSRSSWTKKVVKRCTVTGKKWCLLVEVSILVVGVKLVMVTCVHGHHCMVSEKQLGGELKYIAYTPLPPNNG